MNAYYVLLKFAKLWEIHAIQGSELKVQGSEAGTRNQEPGTRNPEP